MTSATNTLSDSHFGVALTGEGITRARADNIRITDNVFEDIDHNALKVDRPTTGIFADNILVDSGAVTMRGLGAGSVVKQVGNVVQNTLPLGGAEDDLYALRNCKAKLAGGLLENDDLIGSAPILKVMGQLVQGDGIRLTGVYGVVDMETDGHFIYRIGKDGAAKLDAAKGAPAEHFSYQVTDALGTHSAELVIDLSHWNDGLL